MVFIYWASAKIYPCINASHNLFKHSPVSKKKQAYFTDTHDSKPFHGKNINICTNQSRTGMVLIMNIMLQMYVHAHKMAADIFISTLNLLYSFMT